MKTTLVLVLLFITSTGFAAHHHHRVLKTTSQIEVPLTPIPNTPFYTVDVSLGEFGHTKMLLDTEASETVIADWIVKKEEIPPYLGEEGTEMMRAKVTEIRLGRKSKTVKFLYVIPTPPAFRSLKIGGVINPQKFFAQQDLFLDFPLQRLVAGNLQKSLLKKRQLLGQAPLRACSIEQENKLVTDAAINGDSSTLTLSTGLAKTSLRSEVAKQLGANSRSGFALGKIKAEIEIGVAPIANCPRAEGQLGNDILKNYGVLISADRSELRLFK